MLRAFLASAILVVVPACAQHGEMAASTTSPPLVLANTAQIERDKLALDILQSDRMRGVVRQIEDIFAADPIGSTTSAKARLKLAAQETALYSIEHVIQEAYSDEPAFLWFENAPHRWGNLEIPGAALGIDNPTAIYRTVVLDPNATYAITGSVKGPGPAQLHFEARDTLAGGSPINGPINPEGAPQTATLNGETMLYNEDGSFTASLDKYPANGRKNHIQVPATGRVYLTTRDLLMDWEKQNIYTINIKKIAGDEPAPDHDINHITERSAEVAINEAKFWLAWYHQYVYKNRLPNQLKAAGRAGGRGLGSTTLLHIADDEALVLTVDPAGAKGFDIQTTDTWGVQLEYVNHLTSYNIGQSKANSDGTYTYVISPRDPGVRNWIDTQGYNDVMNAMRWQNLPSPIDPALVIKSYKLVKSQELKSALPDGTEFVTPLERSEQMRQRAKSYLRLRPPEPSPESASSS